jgi:hypothetical protein
MGTVAFRRANELEADYLAVKAMVAAGYDPAGLASYHGGRVHQLPSHRTLSTYIRGYRRAGFAIEEILEPSVDAENLQRFPELDDELRVPNFIIVVLQKTA